MNTLLKIAKEPWKELCTCTGGTPASPFISLNKGLIFFKLLSDNISIADFEALSILIQDFCSNNSSGILLSIIYIRLLISETLRKFSPAAPERQMNRLLRHSFTVKERAKGLLALVARSAWISCLVSLLLQLLSLIQSVG